MSPGSDSLWAPWRGEYVRGDAGSPGECLFCRAASDRSHDRENLVLFRREGCMVLLNRFPYINGHLMIAPERHVGYFAGLSGDELRAMTGLIVLAESALRRGMRAEGMNGGWNLGRCAGAGVEGHLHVHLLPRWSGDTNFLTTVAGTRVISESLEESYDLLGPLLSSGEAAGGGEPPGEPPPREAP
ncbi:HIT domain-containing protein [Candidatus Fermentibacterales bacterium]|nr:HIT domain-containing protein [Candidatus Fermentibacterales bacterium]